MQGLFRSKLVLTLLELLMVAVIAIPLAMVLIQPSSAAYARGGLKKAHPTPTTTAGFKKKIGAGNNSPVCQRASEKSIQLSQGGNLFCNGVKAPGKISHTAVGSSFGTNVNAANPLEDRSPSGVQAYGQSEVSIAAAGSFVVEAWNDATSFFVSCSAPMNKAQSTGYAFSNNGGKSFTDLGGLPNSGCGSSNIAGDPSVEAYQVGGSTYFYIASIFLPLLTPENKLSVTVCKVSGSGSAAILGCGDPIVAAVSSDCNAVPFCSFLDKPFMSIDPVHGRLYISYTEFGITSDVDGAIRLAACNLSSPMTPTCFNGSAGGMRPSYLTLAAGNPSGCGQQGSYPAVDVATGDVYAAWEFNSTTNIFRCVDTPTQNVVARVPFACLTLPGASCSGPSITNSVNVISMEAARIPGYDRSPNDFPRIAVSTPKGTVSIVWNDARLHPLGDILLQSFNLGTLSLVQASPVRLDNDTSGALHFLPALRNAEANGNLNVSWYDRRSKPNSALTNVYAAINIDPRTRITPSSNIKVTTAASDWNSVSSDLTPNFGDYTDNYVLTKPRGTSSDVAVLYVAWSDGRIGEPQPFEAKTPG